MQFYEQLSRAVSMFTAFV